MIRLRLLDPNRCGERGLICSTWFHAYSPRAAGVSHTVYEREQPRLIDRILAARGTRVVVACGTGNEDALHAWACGEYGGPLHFAYVPRELRRNGFGRQAIAEVLGTYPRHGDVTHRPPKFLEERFRFNPFPLTRLEAA